MHRCNSIHCNKHIVQDFGDHIVFFYQINSNKLDIHSINSLNLKLYFNVYIYIYIKK